MLNKLANTFKVKGFHLDLRIQVMTPKALHELADDLASMGLNTLVMEWEATYPFKSHPQIPNRFAYKEKDVREFLKYCYKLGIDVMPLQQCFGHVEYILRHPKYSALRENNKDLCQVCPSKPDEAIKVFKSLFKELADTHPSQYFHIGCDETYLLGHCPVCSKKAASGGKSRLFVDYVSEICQVIKSLGKRPVLWADMLLQHPEAANSLPKECILVDWNYGWPNNKFGDPKPLLDTGLTFWGSPALRSHPDDFYLVDFNKHFNNLNNFIPYCKENKFDGMVLTSWSTSGLYGYEYGSQYEAIDLYPIRNVYPLPIARILLSTFAKAIQSDKQPDIKQQIEQYAVGRFRLTEREAAKFSAVLLSNCGVVNAGTKPEKTATIAKSAEKTLLAIKPKSNANEFEHFRMLASIRSHYLSVRELEAKFQSESFKMAQAGGLLKQCKSLDIAANRIDSRFSALLRGYLYPAEIKMENRVRRLRLKLLQERLSRNVNG